MDNGFLPSRGELLQGLQAALKFFRGEEEVERYCDEQTEPEIPSLHFFVDGRQQEHQSQC